MATLIKTLGGPSKFVRRLDYLHESGLLYMGDEQAFLPVFQYHYAGRPAKSAERAHYYIPSLFNASLGGIPGNDDGGGMGSFVALSMMVYIPTLRPRKHQTAIDLAHIGPLSQCRAGCVPHHSTFLRRDLGYE